MKQREPRVEFFKYKSGRWNWRSVGANGAKTVGGVQGGGYSTRAVAKRAFYRNLKAMVRALELGRVFDEPMKFK